ncbi:MAG: nuclear transport factor 2 family protein [Sandarakinorhabdus sp.]|nr:nuclear transport factor 2 family protein [Sandarakinorhabdus sp.]
MTVDELLAREAIRDCIARVARGEDRRDAAMLRGCFHADATLDFGIFAADLDGYLDWVVPGSPRVLLTLHTLGQSLIRVEGARAVAETHIASYHRIDGDTGAIDMTIGGRYLDRLAVRDGAWRITHRQMVYDWLGPTTASADWANGLMGAPFLHDRATGRTLDDASVGLFSPAAGSGSAGLFSPAGG